MPAGTVSGTREGSLVSMSRIAAVAVVLIGLYAANMGEWGAAAICAVLAFMFFFADDK
jgi:hypothetical protein